MRSRRPLPRGRGRPLALLVLTALLQACAPERPLGDRIDDATFWRMVSEFSEPGGYFHSDNFVSNEAEFQYVIPSLRARVGSGGAYVGVGPDQNFTYLVAFRPHIAFIVDIRRQNMLQHLMYKALIELSADRAEFLSRLFARPRPPGLDSLSTPEALFDGITLAAPDTAYHRRNLDAIGQHLLTTHGFALSVEDLQAIEYVYGAFFAAGPDLTYSYGQGGFAYAIRGMPTYAYLQLESDEEGTRHGYLASEANYRTLKDLQSRNLIVPLVGNFAGDKTLRTVGRYLSEHGETVRILYTSNVEQYLFRQGDDWRRFYANVATLPITSASTIIRSVPSNNIVHPRNPNSRSAQFVAPIGELVTAYRNQMVHSYYDIIDMSR
ncbi:MAG TPA: hypothetical protein VLE53_08960 [Gemmatimonadaceae bacterium]|nr:hypothetical protein [Gemmatimonadaceae bacterium]